MASDTTSGRLNQLAAWQQYTTSPNCFDEAVSGGAIRPHWSTVTEGLARIGAAGLERRWAEARRLIHDNGVTYNVYNEQQTSTRPWQLDPVPLVMDPGEWTQLEEAILQRAQLFNLILADLYGPQNLLHERKIPVELVFANPAFLRACWGIQPAGGVYLPTYSADLGRSPDGRWWVLSDRTQAPSGAGYTIENRLVMTRVLPDVFRRAGVRRLAAYFQAYRESLAQLAPRNRENPRIVVLTPGPYSETYFEHAFLARYLGYTLVEGGDLKVRDGKVFLKTLGGLLQVDVIIRRQDDSFCDPLELRTDSMLGVAGLVEVVREGNVAIVNPLGSGLVESPAYEAFLPGLCQYLLGQDLKMPAVATWWCGDAGPRSYVLDNLEHLVFKPTYPSRRRNPVFGGDLSAKEREELRQKILADPKQYVAQEQVALSTVPTWEADKMLPRHLVLRIFAAHTPNGYNMLPGGLTRISSSLEDMRVSMQHGGASKDTWVPGHDTSPSLTLLKPPANPLTISRTTFDLPSRVADNLFWLGRYTERSETALRIARTILLRSFQEGDSARTGSFETSLGILVALGFLPDEGPYPENEKELFKLIADPEEPFGVVANLRQVRSAASMLRDRISRDAWLILNQVDSPFIADSGSYNGAEEEFRMSTLQDRFTDALTQLAAFGGLIMESMTRGYGWRFLDLGRRLERALQMAELLRHGLPVASERDNGILSAILEIADSSMTYRSRYLTSLQLDLVLDLLLIDEANPRSIAFQAARMKDHVDHLPNSQVSIRRPEEAQRSLALLTKVQLVELSEIVPGDARRRKAFKAYFAQLIEDMSGLSNTLSRSYFSHALPSRQRPQPVEHPLPGKPNRKGRDEAEG